ncbi:DUF1365 domain-containing protein [Paracoccus sediminicola]|uniref:DUF1365 domain-containing protein n=1 Tax=Paracoccus sediminicola TaxID=3017783 RepID=UPI0022F0075B|nr:DUF1365 domain-containing protein [Paracoccus sediminicola]WBU58063.1 DUF1365 domain-containing protein [Paracoccus sediminicola]
MSTDLWDGALIDVTIWHARAGDVSRQFRYGACYAALPLGPLEADRLPLRPERGGIWRIRRRDYGHRDGGSFTAFMDEQLVPVGLGHCKTTLVTMPRSPFHGFNPVSFWLARDEDGLRAVLAEVSNTFGERHVYLCRNPDNAPITRSHRLSGEKLFHVSPFLPRDGRYVFRFDPGPGRFGAWVDWFGAGGELRLQTSMTGPARTLSRASLRRSAWRHVFQAQKVTGLIHWQAAKLFSRGIRYRSKPPQLDRTRSEATQTEGKNV